MLNTPRIVHEMDRPRGTERVPQGNDIRTVCSGLLSAAVVCGHGLGSDCDHKIAAVLACGCQVAGNTVGERAWTEAGKLVGIMEVGGNNMGKRVIEIIRANDRTHSAVEHSAYAMIDRQLQQIGRLADDLLDANQVVLGHVELAKQRVLLDAVVERAAEQSRPWIEAARHSLAVELPREAIALDADPKRLARALSNLINNAARRLDRKDAALGAASAAVALVGTAAIMRRRRRKGSTG